MNLKRIGIKGWLGRIASFIIGLYIIFLFLQIYQKHGKKEPKKVIKSSESNIVLEAIKPGKDAVFHWMTSEHKKKEKEEEKEEDEDEEEVTCSYEHCNLGDKDKLNVHIIAHTHDDLGWLKTVDQYYYNSVQYIIESVIGELVLDPKKKFIYVEIGFFYFWWISANDYKRKIVKKLVNKGQLEFILGGWSMNDEAGTHYSSIIDQHTEGFQFLNDTFGECGIPKIGWQIDPFGHSREQASLFAQFGFDAAINSRIDHQEYLKRKSELNFEDIWITSDSLENGNEIFSHTLYRETYSHPEIFCFSCGVEIRDVPDLQENNVDSKVKIFVDHVTEQAKYFKTNHIMLMMGGDFEFENAAISFKNIDVLIKHVNLKESNIKVFYSTPSCYIKAINKKLLKLKTFSNDYFPYSSRDNFYWTGYYTSKPNLKYFERYSNNILQAVKQLHCLSRIRGVNHNYKKITSLKRALGVLQHHDAITGTAKTFVTQHYSYLLANGIANVESVINMALKNLVSLSFPSSYSYFVSTSGSLSFSNSYLHCHLLNISICFLPWNMIKIIYYNPSSHNISSYAEIPILSDNYEIIDQNKNYIPFQISSISINTKKIFWYKIQKHKSEYSITFPFQLPPLGFSTFFLRKKKFNDEGFTHSNNLNAYIGEKIYKPFKIGNEFISLEFDQNGLLKKIKNIEKNIEIFANQRLMYYNPESNSFTISGAYVFKPITEAKNYSFHNVSLRKGNLFEEAEVNFSPSASQIIRVYRGERMFRVMWTVGPMPRLGGEEVISRFITSINSGKTFYTDSNGRQIMKRVRNERGTWSLKTEEKISSNYYPVNTKIFIRDIEKDIQLTIMPDRSEGGSSLASGELELMLHRKCLEDESLGVDETLNELEPDSTGVISKGTHYIFLDTVEASVERHRLLGRDLYLRPYPVFREWENKFSSIKNKLFEWSGLRNPLPPNLHLLTLEDQGPHRVLLRLEHLFEKGEHSLLSNPASVDLRELFSPFKVISLKELTLGANQEINKVQRLKWFKQTGNPTQTSLNENLIEVEGTKVTLKAMEIRTFYIKIQNN